MAFAQGTFAFPGIDTILSGNFALTPGFKPSVCTLTIIPQPKASLRIGDLTLAYGGQKITFRDCTVDDVQAMRDASGRSVWQVKILDRRWRWANGGRISGYYNVHRPLMYRKETELVPGTEKSPRDLAKLCLEAMGEKNFDLSKMPNDARPEVEWDAMKPAEALAQLCDSLQCILAPGLDDRFTIYRVGDGKLLPINQYLLSGALEVDPPEQPEEIAVVTSPVMWQADLKLKAVGLDVDWKIKPIDELSYTPTNGKKEKGWAHADPAFECIKDLGARTLAKRSVWLWYQIEEPIKIYDGKKAAVLKTSDGEEIKDLQRILPLLDHQLLDMVAQGIPEEVKPSETLGKSVSRPAAVYGKFYNPAGESLSNDLARYEKLKKLKEVGGVPPEMRNYDAGFSVDARLGLIQFSQPVYSLTETKAGKEGLANKGKTPAELYLRIAFHLRNKTTRGWIRAEHKRNVGKASSKKTAKKDKKEKSSNGSSVGVHDFRHDDLQPKYLFTLDTGSEGKWWTNEEKIKEQADYYLKEHLKQYETKTPATGTYAGFQKFEPDGLITQVSWYTDDDGFAYTKAVLGKEDQLDIIAYQERRLMERILEAERTKAQTKREEAARQRRSQT
jgi:hypothetical protein